MLKTASIVCWVLISLSLQLSHAAFASDTALTIFGVVRPGADTGSYRALAGKGDGGPNYGFLLALPPGENRLSLYLHNEQGDSPHATWAETSTQALAPGVWSQFAAAWSKDAGKLQYFVNGLPAGSYATLPGTIGINDRPTEVGTMINYNYPFGGEIGTILIFDRLLGLAEIRALCEKFRENFPDITCE